MAVVSWPLLPLAHTAHTVATVLQIAAVVIVVALLVWVGVRSRRRGSGRTPAEMRDDPSADG